MKRRREMEKGSELRSAIEELSMVVVKVKPGGDDHNDAVAHIPTQPFLFVCNLVIQVLDKIGPTMSALRQDMDQNIQRLEKMHESDPSVHSSMVEILKKEASEGNARKSTSCSRAFVWLTRALDFTVALLRLLVKDFGQSMEQAVEEAYTITLRPWHGWISATAYRVALKLVPDNKTFIGVLVAKDKDLNMLKEEMQALISLLVPLLEQCHSVLISYGLDRIKST
ncbi:glycolipid transfer protein 3-like isoform X2 [Camellia sinensis]|uniref:glycolipid transfer protein 3-like isoform X2 n=1 Tax=Camellia sinensis TaxID=4442 RepID=UPI001035E85E|nr:glycolipid transfer protein 3-like isoform X2 [Camellia sinensis]